MKFQQLSSTCDASRIPTQPNLRTIALSNHSIDGLDLPIQTERARRRTGAQFGSLIVFTEGQEVATGRGISIALAIHSLDLIRSLLQKAKAERIYCRTLVQSVDSTLQND